MVTSNNLPDKKVVKMAEQNNSVVVPQRTLLGEVNEHLTCPLCRGYYIDATTIVECLHSFCRSCIIKHLQVKSYCPECEMMINSARPNIKPDKALQDIVYKLVPGLFQREMERRKQFYSSRPGPAASVTPEQRGEDTERVIFSPEDVISFSLEYADVNDTDSISSKSSDSNEPQPTPGTARRYLQCPAVVNISHLKKFISMKFDIDSTLYSIDIFYKRVLLPDYYTLMDIAYIYNWKRNEPMKFVYQINDYTAIRPRYAIFDMNRKRLEGRKSSPAPTDDTNASSPAHTFNDQGSEASSGTDSPMPEETSLKKNSDFNKKPENTDESKPDGNNKSKATTSKKSNEDEVEKSQFLNSFELTPKSSAQSSPEIPSSNKAHDSTEVGVIPTDLKHKSLSTSIDDSCKRKHPTSLVSDFKKPKVEVEKLKLPVTQVPSSASAVPSVVNTKTEQAVKSKNEAPKMTQKQAPSTKPQSQLNAPAQGKDLKQPQQFSKQASETTPLKRPVSGGQQLPSPKRKPTDAQSTTVPKTMSPLKQQLLKPESVSAKSHETPKSTLKKMPDLKPTTPSTLQNLQMKGPTYGKVRMDLLANNSDPTMDRSKILSQVKTSLGSMQTQMSGDPLKSLGINIPSSLSITLTDQKLEQQRNQNESSPSDPKKNIVNKNLTSANSNNMSSHKVPSPPVHNYIEILKIPDADPKRGQQQSKQEGPKKLGTSNTKPEASSGPAQPKPAKSETSAKGPMPSLKPIAETKIGKGTTNFGSPITFQQTFEQQLHSIQTEKPKLPKTKMQVPKLMPATPKAISEASKLNTKLSSPSNLASDSKTPVRGDNALDLSNHNLHGPISSPQNKALEAMQPITNQTKKQTPKSIPITALQTTMFSSMVNRSGQSPSLIAAGSSNMNQNKPDRINMSAPSQINSLRADIPKLNPANQGSSASPINVPSPSYQSSHSSPSGAQSSPRPQTRSPSTSPKLIIAEEKQVSELSQSNQINTTQLSNPSKSESPKPSASSSKPVLKSVKPVVPPAKYPGIRPPVAASAKPGPAMSNPADYLVAQHTIWNMELQNAWFKAQRQIMSKITQQSQNNFKDNNKQ